MNNQDPHRNTPHLIELPSGKEVLASAAYSPRHIDSSRFVGRDVEKQMVVAAWMGCQQSPPLSPILIGHPGVGKNRLVYEIAREAASPLYVMQGHEDLTPEDLACAVRFQDEGKGGMQYVISPLVTAMRCGGICFLDEIGKIRPRSLALLVSVLDERRYIDSTLLGERVEAHPQFRFIAATNVGELELLPDFIRSRLRPVIEVTPPGREEIEQMVEGFLPEASAREETLDAFWELWSEKKTVPSPREAIQHFAIASSLGQMSDGSGNATWQLAEPVQSVRNPDKSSLETAFNHLNPGRQ